MIRSFEDDRLEQIFDGHAAAGFAERTQQAVLRKLLLLHAAGPSAISRLARPEALHCARRTAGRTLHLLRVEGPLHLRFRWANGDAYGVSLLRNALMLRPACAGYPALTHAPERLVTRSG